MRPTISVVSVAMIGARPGVRLDRTNMDLGMDPVTAVRGGDPRRHSQSNHFNFLGLWRCFSSSEYGIRRTQGVPGLSTWQSTDHYGILAQRGAHVLTSIAAGLHGGKSSCTKLFTVGGKIGGGQREG